MGRNKKITDNWRRTLIKNCLLCKNCTGATCGNYNMLKSASYVKISFYELLNLFNNKFRNNILSPQVYPSSLTTEKLFVHNYLNMRKNVAL